MKKNHIIFAGVFILLAILSLLVFYSDNQSILSTTGISFFEKREYVLPSTGTIILGDNQVVDQDGIPGGEDTSLAIHNSKNQLDIVAVVTYSNSIEPIIGIFIRNRTVGNFRLKDGTYNLYIHSGHNWNPESKKFESNSRFSIYSKTFSFPLITKTGRYLSEHIELQDSGSYDNIHDVTSAISEGNFPDLSFQPTVTITPTFQHKITDGYWCKVQRMNVSGVGTNVNRCLQFLPDGSYKIGYSIDDGTMGYAIEKCDNPPYECKHAQWIVNSNGDVEFVSTSETLTPYGEYLGGYKWTKTGLN
jgi:hypothetical protein